MSGITVHSIMEAVAGATGITYDDLVSPNRSVPIARARQIAMWAARVYSGRTLTEIGRIIGDRDHSTVRHGYIQIQAEIDAHGLTGDVETVARAIELTVDALQRFSLTPDPDIDPLDVARRTLVSQRSAMALTLAELRTMASYVVALVADGVDPDEEPAPPPAITDHVIVEQIVEVPTSVPDPLIAAARDVILAGRVLETDRYGRGEKSAIDGMLAAVANLTTAWEAARPEIPRPKPDFKTTSKALERSINHG